MHKALETYPVPKHLRRAGKATRPIFRDIAELTAAHSLSEKIRDAVENSRVLIVLCSPAAKASHWVNEEIKLFREIHGDASILAALIEGTPEAAFPEALIQDGREPLAASLGASNAGFKLGVTQLAAGMLGTGLDELVQRGAKRRTRRMGAGLAASFALSAVMGFTAYQAVDARNEAQSARGDAEGLVEYMIKDLKVKLEPVGRLDLLEGIGEKAVAYYDSQDIKTLSDASLTRQAAARQVLAQVALDAGRMEEAQREIEASAALTREVLARNPDDTDAIFAHAQSEYWVGLYYFDQNQFAEVQPYWAEYNRLSQKLHHIDPNNFDWIMEAAWSANAMGAYYDRQKDYERAKTQYDIAAKYARLAIKHSPDNPLPRGELANILTGQARAALYVEPFTSVNLLREEQENIYASALLNDPQNFGLIYKSSFAKFRRFVELTQFTDSFDIEALNESIQGLDVVTKLDGANQAWLKTNYSAKFFRLSYFYEIKDSDSFNSYYSDFMRQGTKLLKSESGDLDIEAFSTDLSRIRHAFLAGEKVSAQNEMMKINKLFSGQTKKHPRGAFISATLMMDNIIAEDMFYAKVFAEEYLNYPTIKPVVQTPYVLYHKIIALAVLEDCDTAKRDAQIFSDRQFILPKIYVNNCINKIKRAN